MKPRERIFKALSLEEPDRVPVFDWGFYDNPSNLRIVEEIVGSISYPPVDAVRCCKA